MAVIDVIGVTFAELVGGQNLNFAVPINYATALLADAPIKPLAVVNSTAPTSNAASELTSIPEQSSPTGSYTRTWQSARYRVSGAATLTIRIAKSTGFTDAEIFLTGGEVTELRT